MSRQAPGGEDVEANASNRSVVEPAASGKIRKPGRKPRLGQAFVIRAGTLWQKVVSDSPAKVSNDQLRQVPASLDADGYLPPGKYLEGKCARELKAFNSRNSNSKFGPIQTWSELVPRGDKDLLRPGITSSRRPSTWQPRRGTCMSATCQLSEARFSRRQAPMPPTACPESSVVPLPNTRWSGAAEPPTHALGHGPSSLLGSCSSDCNSIPM